MFPTPTLLARQGRTPGVGLRSVIDVAAAGEQAWVLGSSELGQEDRLQVGEWVEVSLVADLRTPALTFAFFRTRIDPPSQALPAGVFWRLTAWVVDDGSSILESPRATYDIDAPTDQPVAHVFAVPLTQLASRRNIARLRLELAGTPGEYVVGLPRILLSELVLSTQGARATLINTVPQGDDTNARVGTGIYLEINDPGRVGILAADTTIRVNGALAFDGPNGSVFVAPYDGPDSDFDFSPGLDGGATAWVRLDPSTDLNSSTLYTVQVQTTAYDGFPDTHVYSFQTEDLTQPFLVVAQARDHRTVRVTVSEPIVAADPGASGDALNPVTWVIAIASVSLDDGLPAVPLTVVSVAQVDGATFDLLVDIDITAGALYSVTAGGAEDLVGNVITADAVTFSGFACPVPAGRDFDLYELLPQMNRAEDQSRELEAFIACLQEVLNGLLCDVDRWPEIIDLDVADEPFLDAILVSLGNPFSFDLDETDKRRLARVLVQIYKLKGTDPGIISSILFFLGLTVTIEVPAFDDAWILGDDELGVGSFLGSSSLHDKLSFFVRSGIVLTDEQRTRITQLVRYMMRAECHFLGILEPEPPPALPDHWEVGLSELGVSTLLH